MTNHPTTTSTRRAARPRGRRRPVRPPGRSALAALGVAALHPRRLRGVVGVDHDHHVRRDDQRPGSGSGGSRRRARSSRVPRAPSRRSTAPRSRCRTPDRADDGHLHPEHDLPPDRPRPPSCGDRRLVHLRLRQADLGIVVDHGAFGEPITATTVSISQPVSGAAPAASAEAASAADGVAAGGGSAPVGPVSAPTAPGSRPPGAEPVRQRPVRRRDGEVTAVNGSAVTVDETNPRTKKTTSVVVTLSGEHHLHHDRVGVVVGALAVGQCARAIGSANTTGAITAQSITVSAPGRTGAPPDSAASGEARGAEPGGAVTTGA